MSNEIRVIKYEGDNSTFIWKHPAEDFDAMTQLIVHESQEAVFFMNGEALDLFGPGRHTLETQNIPQIGKFLKLTNHKDGTPFHCEVYFINKAVHMGLKWGTDSRIRFIDPESGIPLDIGASGEANLAVSDSRKLLVKLVGTTYGLNNNDILKGNGTNNYQQTISGFFRAPLVNEVKTYLATVIKEKNINILEIDERTNEISEELRRRISPKFEEYGLYIPNFYVTNVSLPEDDKNFQKLRQFRAAYLATKEAEIQAKIIEAQRQRVLQEQQTEILQKEHELRMRQLEEEKKKRAAQAEAEAARLKGFAEASVMQAQGIAKGEAMKAQGYTQKDVLETEAQKAWAQGMGNIGSGDTVINGSGGGTGNLGTDVVSMMAQMKMAGYMFDKMDGIFPGSEKKESAPAQSGKICPECGATVPERAKFCLECGHSFAPVPKKCPSCGAEVPENSKFCLECGTKIQ